MRTGNHPRRSSESWNLISFEQAGKFQRSLE